MKLMSLYDEVKPFLLARIAEAQELLGAEHDLTLNFRATYGYCLYNGAGHKHDDGTITIFKWGDVAEAASVLEDVDRRVRRIFGDGHPDWINVPQNLAVARHALLTKPRVS